VESRQGLRVNGRVLGANEADDYKIRGPVSTFRTRGSLSMKSYAFVVPVAAAIGLALFLPLV
jgi:hypothetical protein